MAAGDVTIQKAGSNLAIISAEADADAAVNVVCGFQPDRIKLFYKDTGATTNDVIIEWFAGMTAGYYWKTVMSTGVVTLETSGGPTLLAESESNATGAGITIPAGLMDADSDTIYGILERAN